MSEWLKVGTREEIVSGAMNRFHTGERWVSLHQWKDKIFAIDDSCPHRGASLADSSPDDAGYVECHLHNWEFHLETGQGRFAWQRCVSTFPIKEEDGFVFVSSKPNERISQ